MRVSRACQRCRLRKYKCDGSEPCSACSSAEHLCQYDPNFRKRGLVEGYVRGLERLLGLAVSNDPHFEELVISILKNRDDRSVRIKSPAHGWAIGHGKGTLLRSWKDSEVARNVEALIPALDALDAGPWRTVSPNEGCGNAAADMEGFPGEYVQDSSVLRDDETLETHTPDILLPSTFESDTVPPATAQIPMSRVDTHSVGNAPQIQLLERRSSSPAASPISQQPQQPWLSDDLQKSMIHEPSYPRSLAPPKLPKRAGKLLQEYFCSTHCWLPIIGKYDALRLSYLYDGRSRIVPRVSPSSGEFAALWAILAYQSSYEADNSHQVYGGAIDHGEPASTLYINARALIPSEDMEFELGHVQALLLLALYNARFGQWTAAWLLCGQAIRVAGDLELDKLYSPTEAARLRQRDGGRNRRKFVFLGCFTVETFLAARLGRVPHLRAGVLQSVDLLEEDGSEEWELWQSSNVSNDYDTSISPSFLISTFNRLVEVMKVLNDVLCDKSYPREWKIRSDEYHSRLSSIREKCREIYLPNWTQDAMPHQSILQLMHIITARQIGTRTMQHQQQSTPDCRRPGLEDLMLQFRSCYKAFQTRQLPPVIEYFAHAALCELSAAHISSESGPSSEYQLLKEVLYDVALIGTGQAFEELQTRIHADGQLASRRDTSLPSLRHGPRESSDQPATCSYSENTLGFGDNMAEVARALLDLPTIVSRHTSSLIPAENQQNHVDISGSKPPIQPLPNYLGEAETLQPSPGQESETRLLLPLSDNTLDSPIPAYKDVDGVFLGLAHLDTTEW
jgi:hypothetical protein